MWKILSHFVYGIPTVAAARTDCGLGLILADGKAELTTTF